MVRLRNSESSNSILDLVKKRRQLRTTEEISRNRERSTINSLEDERLVLSLGTVLKPKRTRGRWSSQSEPASGNGEWT